MQDLWVFHLGHLGLGWHPCACWSFQHCHFGFGCDSLVSVSSVPTVIALKSLGATAMRWRHLCHVPTAKRWVSSVPRISRCGPSLKTRHHLLVVLILCKLHNVFPASLMVSHVDDLLLVVEACQSLQFCNNVVQHNMESVAALIVAR